MSDESKGPLVLIVEDELMIASTLEMMLGDKGYQIAGPASTLDDAFALLQTVRPDAALLDYRLGGSTTEPLLAQLQERDIPVCILTGYGRDALPERYQLYPLLQKPFSLGELLGVLRQLCAEPSH